MARKIKSKNGRRSVPRVRPATALKLWGAIIPTHLSRARAAVETARRLTDLLIELSDTTEANAAPRLADIHALAVAARQQIALADDSAVSVETMYNCVKNGGWDAHPTAPIEH